MKRLLGLLVAGCVGTALQAAPAQMQAIVRAGSGMSLQTVATPKPAAGQVLIRVYAAAVNPVDWKRITPIPGFDIAGVIDSVGAGVTAFKPGDAVFARATDAYAQYAVAPAEETALKPKRFTYEQASGIPVAGVAGYRAVKEAKVKPGQRVAIIGAAGGTGSAAVQVAKADGAKVIAIGHSSQEAFLKALHVDEFVAYDKDNVPARVSNVDAVLNMVDGQSAMGLTYVRRGGYLTSIAGGVPGKQECDAAGVTCVPIGGGSGAGYGSISNAEALPALAAMADKGQYDVVVTRTFPLAEAGAAQQLGRTTDVIGKIILVVDPKSKDK